MDGITSSGCKAGATLRLPIQGGGAVVVTFPPTVAREMAARLVSHALYSERVQRGELVRASEGGPELPREAEARGASPHVVPVTWNADDWEALAITLRSLAEGPDGTPRVPDTIEAAALQALAARIGAGLHGWDPSQYMEHDGRTYHPEPGEDAGADRGGA